MNKIYICGINKSESVTIVETKQQSTNEIAIIFLYMSSNSMIFFKRSKMIAKYIP